VPGINLRGSSTQESIAKAAQQEALKSAKHRGPLDLSRIGFERDLKEAISGIDKLAKAVKDVRKQMAENVNLEMKGSMRVFRMKQEEHREEERELRKRQQTRRRFWQSVGVGGAVGGIVGNVSSGRVGGIIGAAGGAAGGGLGFALGGPVGAMIGEALGSALGVLVNPLKGAYSSAKPFFDYQRQAYSLGRTMGLPGAAIQQTFYPNRHLRSWEYNLGVGSQEALKSVQALGVTPRGSVNPLAFVIRQLELSGALSGLPSSSIQGYLGTALGIGGTAPTAKGALQVGLNLETVMEKANERGFNRSRLLQSMEQSLRALSQNAFGVNASSVAGLYTGFANIRGGGAAGTGGMAASIIAGASHTASDVSRNKLALVALQTLAPKYNYWRTAADVKRFAGGASLPPEVVAQITSAARINPMDAEILAMAAIQGNPALVAKRYLQGTANLFPGELSHSVAPFIVSAGLGVPLTAAMGYVAQQRTSARLPLGIRLNNPLNLKTLPGGRLWAGQLGSVGAFPQFGTQAEGISAAIKNMRYLAKRDHVSTLGELIDYWDLGPRAVGPKALADKISYLREVEKLTGWQANTRLNFNNPAMLRKLLPAMIAHEDAGYRVKRATLQQGIIGAGGITSLLNIPREAFHAHASVMAGDLNEAALAAESLVPLMQGVVAGLQRFAGALSHSNAIASSHNYGVTGGHKSPAGAPALRDFMAQHVLLP
jgi:hypothetical protein